MPWFSLFILYSIYFFDLVGIVIVFVIFSPMLVGEASPFFAPDVALGTRNLVLGGLLAAYPVAQFFGAPLLGEISDRFGRKPILLISTLGTAIGFAFSGGAILLKSLFFLFISRFISGLMAGNLTVTNASVAELVPKQRVARYMAAFSMVGGIGWIVGPYLGTALGSIGYSLPFWVLGSLFALIFVALIFGFRESLAKKEGGSLHPIHTFVNLGSVFKIPHVTNPLLISIVNIWGWMMYQAFLAAYLVERFHFSLDWEGYAYVVSSVFWFIGGLLTNQWFLRRHSPKTTLIAPLFISAIFIGGYLVIRHPIGVWGLLSVANTAEAVIFSCFFALFPYLVPSSALGKLFGTWNAGFALACGLAPILSGWLVTYSVQLPFAMGALIMLGTAIWGLVWHLRNRDLDERISSP